MFAATPVITCLLSLAVFSLAATGESELPVVVQSLDAAEWTPGSKVHQVDAGDWIYGSQVRELGDVNLPPEPGSEDAVGTPMINIKGIPQWMVPICNYALAQSMAGLTGVKASIPILMVAVGNKFYEDFPFKLSESFEWLESWLSIIFFGAMVVGELIGDSIPVVDEMMDSVLIFIKPALSILIAIAPVYNEGGAQAVVMQLVSAANAAFLSFVMAGVKAGCAMATDAVTCGMGAPVRSTGETVIVIVLAVVSFSAVFVGMALCVGLQIMALYRCCCKKQDDDDDDDEDSEEEGDDKDSDDDEESGRSG